eukprot:jgi/Chlat1/8476/Chrsp80S07872
MAWSFVKRMAFLTPICMFLNDTVASMKGITGRSMQPTLNPPDAQQPDRVLLERLSARACQYRRGDVIVLRSPEEPHLTLVKRMIALEGDWVTLPGRGDIEQVPKGHCWVEGDNAANSSDSNHYGPVPLALIEGRVTHIIWPLDRIGRIESKVPEGRVLVQSNTRTWHRRY